MEAKLEELKLAAIEFEKRINRQRQILQELTVERVKIQGKIEMLEELIKVETVDPATTKEGI